MMQTWDLIREAIIGRATRLALQDALAQFERGESPELHLDECLKQAMAELVTLFQEADKTVEEHMKSEKKKEHDATIH